MAAHIPNDLRDELITSFRGRIMEKLGISPFPHQAEWMGASDGLLVTDQLAQPGDPFMRVRLGRDVVEDRLVLPRPGGRARVIADLGAFKIGKSYGAALWTASFAVVPGARVQLVGLEYDICEPEFNYLVEFLLSDAGMGLKYESLQNRPRDGRMWLEFPNGARFEAKSWERKDTMKGKEIDAYIYCEAYQLPGLECYTSFSQNLRARNGFALFPTTPDRPWVKDIHDAAHSGLAKFAAWHCTCSVHSSQNFHTFDAGAMDRDRSLMTREKFLIHYEGKLGDYVGKVFQYLRGEKQFTPRTHPYLFDKSGAVIVPEGWTVVGACDTGTYTSALAVMFSPDGDAFVLEEFPNYGYVSSQLELDQSSTIPSWARKVERWFLQRGQRPILFCDRNSQWRNELQNYGLILIPNKVPKDQRTEVAREYFTHNKIWLAPHLSVLPFELEWASWPEEATAAGKFERLKEKDHTLDPLEHILSRRPQGEWARVKEKAGSWAAGAGLRKRRGRKDAHLGAL